MFIFISALSSDRPQGPPLLPHAASFGTLDGPDFSEFFKQHTCYGIFVDTFTLFYFTFAFFFSRLGTYFF